MFIQEFDIPKFVMRRKSIDLQFSKEEKLICNREIYKNAHGSWVMGHGSVGISL